MTSLKAVLLILTLGLLTLLIMAALPKQSDNYDCPVRRSFDCPKEVDGSLTTLRFPLNWANNNARGWHFLNLDPQESFAPQHALRLIYTGREGYYDDQRLNGWRHYTVQRTVEYCLANRKDLLLVFPIRSADKSLALQGADLPAIECAP